MTAAMGIPILANEIAQRVAYAESLTMGKMIFEWADADTLLEATL